MAAPAIDKSRVPREILFGVARGIVELIGEKGLWRSTEGFIEAIESIKHTASATMNPDTVYDAAKTFHYEIMSRLNFDDARAEGVKGIIDEALNRIRFDILLPRMPSVPSMAVSTMSARTPSVPSMSARTLTREEAQAEFLRIHETIKMLPLNPKLIDNPEDRVGMEAWFAHHESRMSGVTKPSQLMRIIADLLKFMGKSSSEPVKIAKTYLIEQHKYLQPLAKVLGGRRTKKQPKQKRKSSAKRRRLSARRK